MTKQSLPNRQIEEKQHLDHTQITHFTTALPKPNLSQTSNKTGHKITKRVSKTDCSINITTLNAQNQE